MGDGVAENYYERGERGLKEGPDSNMLKSVHHDEDKIWAFIK